MANDTSKNLGVYYDAVTNRGYASHVNAKDMVLLTNKSGGSVATGDVVVQVMTTNNAFTTSTTDKDMRPAFVVPANISGDNVSASKTIENDEAGWVYRPGAYVPEANVSGAVSRGEYLKVGTTAKKFTGTGQIAGTNPRPVEACAIALEAATGADSIAVMLLNQMLTRLPVAVLADQKASGTAGGSAVTGAIRTRDLNTEVSDPDGIVTLSSNQFTPVAGTYFIIARAPFYRVDSCAIYLFSTASQVLIGSTSYSASAGAYAQTDSWVFGTFTANGSTAYYIGAGQQTTRNTDGFGLACADGSDEIYTQVTLIKLA